MIIDLILITIMVICLVLGFRKGFLYTIVHSLGWLISLAGAFFHRPGGLGQSVGF